MLLFEPWPHMVVDNYFSDETFKNMSQEITNFSRNLKEGKTKVINPHQKRGLSFTSAALHENHISEELLSGFPNIRKYDGPLTWLTEIAAVKGYGYQYPAHCDHSKKILSAITYILPKSGNGTVLYNKDKVKAKTIEWQPNRTLIFAPQDGLTWHSYGNGDYQLRITLNQYLISDDVEY